MHNFLVPNLKNKQLKVVKIFKYNKTVCLQRGGDKWNFT